VPTIVTTRLGTLVESNNYAVTDYAMPLTSAAGEPLRTPAVELIYDLSPILMRVHESPLTLAHFLVRLCAVVGGAVSVTRLADGLVDALARTAGRGRGGVSRGPSSGGGLLPTSSSGYGPAAAGNGAHEAPLYRHSSGGGAGLAGSGSGLGRLQSSSSGGLASGLAPSTAVPRHGSGANVANPGSAGMAAVGDIGFGQRWNGDALNQQKRM
jgi:hypothetical protein